MSELELYNNPLLSFETRLGAAVGKIEHIESELAAALALSEERRAMLEKIAGDEWGECIECGDEGEHHAPDCELARLIKGKP